MIEIIHIKLTAKNLSLLGKTNTWFHCMNHHDTKKCVSDDISNCKLGIFRYIVSKYSNVSWVRTINKRTKFAYVVLKALFVQTS